MVLNPYNIHQMAVHYQIFPNPVISYFVVKSHNPLDEHINLSIFSHEGLLFRKYEFIYPDDNYEYMVDVRNIPPGNYYIMIHSERGYAIERMNKM